MKTALLFTPFLFFLIGFYGSSLLVRKTPFETPSLIGLPLAEAVTLLSEKELNARILAKKEKYDIEPGTVLEQIPHPAQRIKPHQSVFLIVAQQPQKTLTPNFLNLTLSEAQKKAENLHLKLKIWMIPDIAPKNKVVSQWPMAEKALDKPWIILYVSEGTTTSLRLMPDLKGMPIAEAEERLKKEDIKTLLSYSSSDATIQAQKPLAGSIVDVSKPITVQLQG